MSASARMSPDSTPAQTNTVSAAEARRFIVLLSALLIAVTALSLVVELKTLDARHLAVASEEGRTFFEAINVLREWNLAIGGFYVPVAAGIAPNPYLADPRRDVATIDGERLTLVNHSHMTRLFSDLLREKRGIQLHITSARPIRPENAADAWERVALRRFESGTGETYEVAGEGNTFRYMGRLQSDATCARCHSSTPPEVVRGGISVSFPYAPFDALVAQGRRRTVLVHVIFLGAGLGVVFLMGSRLLGSIRGLEASMLRIKRLEGFLPICASCKKIRVQGGQQGGGEAWVSIEAFIEDRTDAEFTHTVCPVCARKLYPDLGR